MNEQNKQNYDNGIGYISRLNFNDGYEKKDDLSKLDDLIHKFSDKSIWN